jgi:hypothetical protein
MAKKNLSAIDQAHRLALERIARTATVEEAAALIDALEAAPVLRGNTIDAGAAVADFFARLGHPPDKAREMASAALAAPAHWAELLD